MAEHAAFTLAGLLAVGGSFGYAKARSRPTLIAGLGLGTAFGCAGYLLKKNKDYGAELALGSSITLLGAGAHRLVKTRGKSPIAIGLGASGALATYYYQRKFREFRYGV